MSGSRRGASLPPAGSEPAALLEEREEAGDGEEFESDAESEEDGGAFDMSDHPAEVLAEEAGDEGEWQEDGRHDGELLHDGVEPVGDGGEVDVHRACEQVAVGVDHVADADQVVVDVAEVAFVVLGHTGELRRRRRRDWRTCRVAV